MPSKAKVLLVGAGSVGAIAAVNLEKGQQANVTIVCRSNYEVVRERGFFIDSCDHGVIEEFRPAAVLKNVPTVGEEEEAFDYVVCTTKNVADVSPSLVEIIRPAVTTGKTAIVLIQNGLNIEKPLLEAFPQNVLLSGISMIGSSEIEPGRIKQDNHDVLFIGPFRNPNLLTTVEKQSAQDFVQRYGAAGKTNCSYDEDVPLSRWRKLVFNACLNPICAITGLDTGRLRLADGAIESLARPAMREIVAAASAAGHTIPESVYDQMINMDPLELYIAPSMLSDVRKGNFLEFETLIGEPLREGEKLGVLMPTIRVLYHLCQAIQWKTKESKGLVTVPPPR